ncbi:MAG: HAD-IIIA family hydrolase [Planctomycetota bacterium]
MKPAVFLDLDNTIIEDNDAAANVQVLALIKGAAPAIASFRGLGYKVVVVANHEGVARGRITEQDVQSLHAHVNELVRQTANGAVIDAFYYCPYHPRGEQKAYRKDHVTRKPKPGMLQQAAEDHSLDLHTSWMIGDELADVQAGHAAGARTILLRPDAEQLMPVDPATIEGVTSEPPDRERPSGPDFFAVNLVDAARLIAQQPRVEQAEIKPTLPGRKWDAEKIAKLQVPRPPKDSAEPQAEPAAAVKAFRPWGAPAVDEDDTPIVTKPFRKRHQAQSDEGKSDLSVSAVPAPPLAEAAVQDIPDTIRHPIGRKTAKPPAEEAESDKTLRLILHELRAQRGSDQEVSFITIIAIALQLVAIVCLLGGLFMGGENDSVFLRWLGVSIMAQLTAIATLLYGR